MQTRTVLDTSKDSMYSAFTSANKFCRAIIDAEESELATSEAEKQEGNFDTTCRLVIVYDTLEDR